VIIGSLLYLIYEIYQLATNGLRFFLRDPYNWFDVASLLIVIFVVSNDFFSNFVGFEEQTLSNIAAFGAFLLCMKIFYWFRLFTGLSFYMRLIRETIQGIKHIIIILLAILIMFCFVNYIIKKDQEKDVDSREEDEDSETGIRNAFVRSLLNQYLVGLGEFNTDGFGRMEWAFFILATFIT
jgi:hypothetical protein